MSATTPTFSFVIVNYKSRAWLMRCLFSIATAATRHPFEVIIVNNDTSALHAQQTSFLFPARIVEQQANCGYGRASNVGARHARGMFLCFLNPDAALSPAALAPLHHHLQDPTVGIAAPRLTTAEGRVQPWCAGVPLSLGEILLANCGLPRSRKLWQAPRAQDVGWVSGAALFVKRDLFSALHGFDEQFFLYFEDVDLCARARALGYRVCFVPESTVEHRGGASSTRRDTQKKHYYTSQNRYFAKHHGQGYARCMRFLRLFHRMLPWHA